MPITSTKRRTDPVAVVAEGQRLALRIEASARVIESSGRFAERMVQFALADPETAGAVLTTATAMLDRAMQERTASDRGDVRSAIESAHAATAASAEDEDLFDIAEARAAMARIESGEEVPIPHDVAMRILEGESSVKAYRAWRGISQARLARAAGLTQGALSDIERGRRRPGLDAAKALAKALGLPVANLIDLD
jgi:DNA-binding XRE family transcriptional regulator